MGSVGSNSEPKEVQYRYTVGKITEQKFRAGSMSLRKNPYYFAVLRDKETGNPLTEFRGATKSEVQAEIDNFYKNGDFSIKRTQERKKKKNLAADIDDYEMPFV